MYGERPSDDKEELEAVVSGFGGREVEVGEVERGLDTGFGGDVCLICVPSLKGSKQKPSE